MATDSETETTATATVTSEADPRNIMGDSVTTRHTLETDGGTLEYTATAGRMVVGEEDFTDGVFQGNKAKAEVFVASYVLDGADPGSRPVTFVFNGGPGSPTVWLQFGLFGPHLIDSGDVDRRVSVPYGLRDNAQTLLADSDLVFIDPMTTGFSRASEGSDPTPFHGFGGDRDLVAEVIRLWTTRHQRWISPKFLAGESYGTTRAAAIAGHLLARHGMAFNGLILISSILDFRTVFFTEGNDEPFVFFLPTYAATAHYHGKHPERSLREVVLEAEEFAENGYRLALARGNRLSDAARLDIAEQVARLTGVSVNYVLESDLRLEHGHYFAELLRTESLMVGRLDTRFTAYPGRMNLAAQETDPSLNFILQPYAIAANHYYRASLGYETELSYELMYGRVMPWSYKEFENASVHTAEEMAKAMRSNPDLKVYLANGFYDASTPFLAAEHVFAHLRIAPQAYENIITYYYEAGHMMYVHEPSRVAQSEHIRDFVRWSLGGERPTVAPEFRLDRVADGGA